MQLHADWNDGSDNSSDAPEASLVVAMTPLGGASKRAFDFAVALIGIIFLLPLLGLIALLIKLDSPGPVFFRQKRAGRGGSPFEIMKFRTMVDGAYLMGSRLTVKRDPRITRLGRILRWAKLDELPQLFNVLRGDMSLIGPRPEDPFFVKFYNPRQRAALSVRPGIVGPSQIVGRDEADEYPEGLRDTESYYVEHILPPKLERDLEYVRTATFWGDMYLLLHGVWITVRGAIRAKYFWRRRRSLGLTAVDLWLSLSSYGLALILLLNPGTDVSRYVWHTVALIVLIRPPLMAYFGCYHLLPSYFGLWDLVALSKSVAAGSLIIAALTYFTGGQSHPRSVFVLDASLLLFMLASSRYIMRAWSRRHPTRVRLARAKVIVAGAGVAGEHLSRALMEDPRSGFQPVGFIDETQDLWGSRIHGVKVLGGIAELPLALSAKKVRAVFVCLSDLPETAAREIAEICATAGVDCRMLPSLADLLRVEGYATFPTQWGAGQSSGIERAH